MPRRDTRTEIVDAAIVLLGRDGPDAFSASTLAKEVGVSKATSFHHFPTIDEIPLAAFDRLLTQMLSMPFDENASFEARLSSLSAMTFAAVEHNRGFLAAYFVFFGKAMFDARLRGMFRQSIDALLARMTEIFTPHSHSTREAEVMARMVAIFLDGLALHLLALEDKPEMERVWQEFRLMVSNHGSQS